MQFQSLIDLEKFRGRFNQEFPTRWFDTIFVNDIEASVNFNNHNISLSISKLSSDESFDKSHYLNSIKAEVFYSGNTFESIVHLFDNKGLEFYYQNLYMLCPGAFTSPYRYDGELLKTAHAKAVQEKYFPQIIGFINQYFDNSIEKIEMTEIDRINRFMVSSRNMDHAVDLTKYGEGLQRVFEIALLLCYCKNGTCFIDELDSAIHKNLLIPFTEFIQRIASEFNVQVFITTHSKECIDAFVENGFSDDELMAYSLQNEGEKIVCKYLEGNKLKQLVESVNIDIR